MRTPYRQDAVPMDLDLFDRVCAASHRSLGRIDVYEDGEPIYENLPLISGELTIDRKAEHRSRLTSLLAPPDELIPTGVNGILMPNNIELRVYRGVEIPGNRQYEEYENSYLAWVSLGFFTIRSAAVRDDKTVQIDGWDRSRRIADDLLTTPYRFGSGFSIEAFVSELVRRTYPDVEIVIDSDLHVTPTITHEVGANPWRIIVDAATATGNEAFFDSDGVFRWQQEPNRDSAEAVLNVHEGVGGILLKAEPTYDAEQAYNYWTVTAENPNTNAEYTAVALDDNLASTTYYYGPFGRKPAPTMRSPYINTLAQAQKMVNALRDANSGVAQLLDFQMVPNPRVEPGDAVSVKRSRIGLDRVVLIDAQTIGLGASQAMTCTVRAQDSA